jgi:DNA (cytosine-5)-methyltransferase 1
MSKPRVLDLFCKAGGAAMGYHRAGWEVVGVDHEPQPNYPFEFHQDDAMEWLQGGRPFLVGDQGFDAIHASPPCQAYSALKTMTNARKHPDLIAPVRDFLDAAGLPYVIENVFGAPLNAALMLCGSMFGLPGLRRHRYFEMNWSLGELAPPCHHVGMTVGVYGAKVRNIAAEKKHYAKDKATRGKPVGVVLPHRVGFEAMGIDWMTIGELSEAIPPAYTEWIGRQLLKEVQVAA